MGYSRRNRYRRSSSPKSGVLLVVLLIIGLVGVSFVFQYSTEETITITVNDKERINNQDSSYYLVFADEGEFKIEDTIAYGNFSSSSLYGKLKAGNKYRVKITGWRVGFMSTYPNIVEILEEIK
jgi:hypothetical protein